MQKRTMFPYRRPGHKKRPRNVQPGQSQRMKDGGRRIPGSARELLPLLQPTTKALAQMLVGKTQASGQLAHARNVLAQAQRMMDERLVERMTPADREEFFEQVARLRLTVADAESEAEAAAEALGAPRTQAPPVARERLREMALALTTPSAEPAREPRPPVVAPEEEEDGAELVPPPGWAPGRPAAGGNRLRLRPKAEDGGEEPPAGANGGDAPSGVKRERLRLRPRGGDPADDDGRDDDGRAAS